MRATVVLVVASLVLILPGLAGFGASLTLTLVLGAVSLAALSLRDVLADLPDVATHDLGRYASDLWLAPLVAVLAIAAFPNASPTELQALGGMAGFIGMVNYFVRPLYLLGYSFLRSLVARPS